MNKAQKNVVVVGFSKEERNSLGIPYIDTGAIHYVKTMREASKYQGYLLVIDNKEKENLTTFDKKYRKTLNKYARIWLYHETCDWEYDKFSNIERVGRYIFEDISYGITEEWEEYKKRKEKQQEKSFNKNKQAKLQTLYNYLKNYKTIKTTKISQDLNLNVRSIERYMRDLNNIYHNIGYDYSKNEWYLIW